MMNMLKLCWWYLQLMRNQWRNPAQIRAMQAIKLRRLVHHAYNTVPYYRALFEYAEIKPSDIASIDDLKRIPITKKADLQSLATHQIISTSYKGMPLTVEHTSGSTGQPFSLRFDSDFVAMRNLLFLRALCAAGYKFGQKLLLITDTKNKRSRRFPPKWQYTSLLNSPQRLCEDLNRFKPDLLYGCKTPLKLLADYIEQTKIRIHRPRTVISTAETLDHPTRRQLARTFRARIFDFYGLTEMGIVGWECRFNSGYHLSEDTTIVEYLPVTELDGAFKLVMTNLHLRAMPLIRFQTGDLVFPAPERQCECGRGLARFSRVEGRLADVIRLKDGRQISPYRLTCALENLEGLKTYQVVQQDYNRFTVLFDSGSQPTDIENRIRNILNAVLGQDNEIVFKKAEQPLMQATRKFRIIESHL